MCCLLKLPACSPACRSLLSPAQPLFYCMVLVCPSCCRRPVAREPLTCNLHLWCTFLTFETISLFTLQAPKCQKQTACCLLLTCNAHLTLLMLMILLAFHPAGTQVPETDSVLATTELQELLEQHQVDLRSLEPSPFDAILPTAAGGSSSSSWAAAGDGAGWQANGSGSGSGTAAGSSGGSGAGTVPASSGSGGYLDHVFRAAALQLFGRQLPAGPLQMRVGRNAGALRP